MDKLTYCFTIYGEVIPGVFFTEARFPDHTILIQRDKTREYAAIPAKNKTIDLINQYGHAIPNSTIADIIDLTKAEFDAFKNQVPGSEWYEYDRKVLFITGAGMSANCVFGPYQNTFENSRSRPPLGPCLFDKKFQSIYSKYPGVKLSLHRLQGPLGVDVEQLFEEDWEEISTYGNPKVLSGHINILYYLQELLQKISFATYHGYDGSNLYGVMIDKLVKAHYRDQKRRKKFAFITFNEDTILELFITRYSKQTFEKIEQYPRINDGIFSVFKPHGSWNWGWKIKNLPPPGNTADFLFHNEVNLHKIYYEMLGEPATMIDWHGYGINAGLHEHGIGKMKVDKSKLSIIHPGNENVYFPALLLPYRDKDEFTMPSQHFWDMKHYLSQVETLVIIGWKGNERLFNRELARSGTKIKKVIIADPNSQDVLNNLSFLNRPGIEIVHVKSFEEFVLHTMDIELGLQIKPSYGVI